MRSLLRVLPLMIGTAASAQAPATKAEHIPIPAAVSYPEGIAIDPATHTAYVTGRGDGQLALIDLAAKTGRTVGDGYVDAIGGEGKATGALGLRLYGDRLLIAGGRTTKIFVADRKTGKITATIETPGPGPGNINDIAVVDRTAYFTDTTRPILWSVDLSSALPALATPWLRFEGTALQYDAARNLNGIVATPDGKALIVVHMGRGQLYRIDLASRAVTLIDLKGETVESTDGLVIRGNTLFAIRQNAQDIVTINLAPDHLSGTVVKRSSVPGLQMPATAAIDRDALIVVNTQSDKREKDEAVRPFTLLRVPLSELGVR